MSDWNPGPQIVWQSQKGEGVRMSVEDLRRKSGKFHRRIRRRNSQEYLAGLAVVAYFSFAAWRTPDSLARAGFGMIVAGVLYLVWHLHRNGSARDAPAEMGLSSGVQFFKQELARQRDLVGSVARWYLGPLMPGWVVTMIALARSNPGHLRNPAVFFTAFNIIAALFFIFVWWLNQRAAHKLQRQIDELDALGGLS